FRSVRPPNEPGRPRAIFHATWGPVHACVTRPVRSSTVTSATSPALPDQALTVQSRVLESNVGSVVGWGGEGAGQDATLGKVRAVRVASRWFSLGAFAGDD